MVKHFCAWVLCLVSLSVWAEAQPFKEGRHYQQVPIEISKHALIEEITLDNPDKVVVIEFFSYGCHWCYQLEPEVQYWLKNNKPDYVKFIRIPVVFQNAWINLSKAYYTAQALNVLSPMHEALFKAIHDEVLTSSSKEALEAFFVKEGVKKEDFLKTFTSFGVEEKYKRSSKLAHAFKITSIPTFIVKGRSGTFFTSTRMAGSQEKLFEVINFLAQEEQKAEKPI